MAEVHVTDDCYRCGYNLHGIADDQACPECGLLAERSRRASDELHLTRPTWLRRLFFGVLSILIGLLAAPIIHIIIAESQRKPLVWRAVSQDILNFLDTMIPLLGLLAGAVAICIGIWLLTKAEGYGQADQADRRRRNALRMISFLPVVGVVALATSLYLRMYSAWMLQLVNAHPALYQLPQIVAITTLLLSSPLPALLFWQLRSLAKRARSAHLAEHCAIVGIGTSFSLIYAALTFAIATYSVELGLGDNWTSRSKLFTLLLALVATAAFMVTLWSLYLMIRFAIAFNHAARQLRTTWNRDDRSLA